MKISSVITITATIVILTIMSGCTTDSGFTIQEPTFENVPPPFDISNVEEEPVVDGITKYTVEEGSGEDQVVIRDQIVMFLTLRTIDGTIIYSSYQNDNSDPIQSTIQSITTPRPPNIVRNFAFDRARTDGLRKGLIGMREGEKRVIIVPPDQGFAPIGAGSVNDPYREDTLRYDVELEFIF
ncbi:FKBP-type peptidyl-prolyl cis-trans isomerase [Rhodohalobacter sp. 8-1]|uniref:FKBP-type peptidyl-prolyl cis-trans isomerase n=1 Tax=Rhodohalobacter sp. 8-1 TaxID=3131972 RepID=UPI0030ED0703